MSADEKTTREDAAPLQDLEGEQLTADDAASVKGGFNPQPDPPKIRGFDPQPDPYLGGIKQKGL